MIEKLQDERTARGARSTEARQLPGAGAGAEHGLICDPWRAIQATFSEPVIDEVSSGFVARKRRKWFAAG